VPAIVRTVVPAVVPAIVRAIVPTIVPAIVPTIVPAIVPTIVPAIVPAIVPVIVPAIVPVIVPTIVPAIVPVIVPTIVPTIVPAQIPAECIGGSPRGFWGSRVLGFRQIGVRVICGYPVFVRPLAFLASLAVSPSASANSELWFLVSEFWSIRSRICGKVALGVYALGMKHSKLWVAILIKTLGAIALGWGLWELFFTAATLARGLATKP